MAVGFYLAIDCGTSQQAADSVASHFRTLNLRLPEIGKVDCDVSAGSIGGQYIVAVVPLGMGYGLPGYSRPELLVHEDAIREALYEHLSLASGFRRAIFCADPCDCIFDSPKESMDIDYPYMIYANTEFSQPPQQNIKPFSRGYSIVLPCNDRDASP